MDSTRLIKKFRTKVWNSINLAPISQTKSEKNILKRGDNNSGFLEVGSIMHRQA